MKRKSPKDYTRSKAPKPAPRIKAPKATLTDYLAQPKPKVYKGVAPGVDKVQRNKKYYDRGEK